MRRTICKGLVAMAVLGAIALAAPAGAETPEELLTVLNEKAKAATTASMTTTIKIKNAYMESTTVSKTVSKREADGTAKFRAESTISQKIQGIETQTKSVAVSDGKVMWSETEMAGTKQVMKMAVPPGSAGDLSAYKAMIAKDKATVLPDETIDGANCAVLQIEAADGSSTTKLWFDEANGMVRKSLVTGKDVGETSTTVSDFKAGIPVDETKFTYTPPADAQVMDLTAGATQ